MSAADLAASIESAERTITNYIWNDTPLGGQLLRELLLVHGVSINWILSGQGTMYVNDSGCKKELTQTPPDPYLIPYIQHTDITVLQDFWWLTARAIEESLVCSNAKPGEDYSRLDLYKLAKPIVLQRYKKTEMDVQAHEF